MRHDSDLLCGLVCYGMVAEGAGERRKRKLLLVNTLCIIIYYWIKCTCNGY